MIEHLQDHAVERGGFLLDPRRFVAASFRDGENAEQTIAEMVDGGIGDDALEIALSERGAGGEDDRGDGQPEQRREQRRAFAPGKSAAGSRRKP